MSNPDEPTKNNHTGSPATTATPTTDVENPTAGTGLDVSSITRRWKREDLLKRGSLIARGLALLFSFLSFIVMASNKHGDWKDFDKYEEYRYLLAIAILSTLYTGGQTFRHVNAIWKRKQIFEHRISAVLDFFADQLLAYLLLSSASSAIPLTNNLRNEQDNIFTDYSASTVAMSYNMAYEQAKIFTDSSASAIAMSFLAFLSLALSAMVSGYRLSTQSYL